MTGKIQNVAMFGLNKELGKFEKQKQTMLTLVLGLEKKKWLFRKDFGVPLKGTFALLLVLPEI
jgi:hypothetical protein